MTNPEKVAATLAIHLIEAKRQSTWAKAFSLMWASRTRVEKLANSIFEKENLPIAPYIPYVVEMIVQHFEDVPAPTEQQIIDWISENGGISGLTLGYMRRGSG